MQLHDESIAEYLTRSRDRSHVLNRLSGEDGAASGMVHTPREVMQQPYLWRDTARRMQRLERRLRPFLENAGLYDAKCKPAVIMTGAGTSDYVGLSLVDLLRQKLGTFTANWPTTRITACPDVFLESSLKMVMIHFARSGNSPESSAVLKMALDLRPGDVQHVVITCNADGELARIARAHPDRVFLIELKEESNDRGLAMTSSFSSMLVAGQALGYFDDLDEFVEQTDHIAAAAEYVIETFSDTIHDLATPDVDRVFYLGNNDLYGAAIESALKVQELTVGRIVAKGEDTLAFRHGPISATDENSLICFYLSASKHTRRYELDVLEQYRGAFQALGTRVLVFGESVDNIRGWERLTTLSYGSATKRNIPPLNQATLAVLVGQLFGVFAAYRRGVNVDNPSMATALYSRTVQGVKIYAYSNGQ